MAKKKHKGTQKLKDNRAASLSTLRADDIHHHNKSNRIRQMFLTDSINYHGDTTAGVFHGRSAGKVGHILKKFIKSYVHQCQ